MYLIILKSILLVNSFNVWHTNECDSPLCPHDVQKLQLRANSLANDYPVLFHTTTIPKLHIVTRHMAPFAKKHGMLGMVQEQSIEHMHAVVNAIESMTNKIRDPIQRSKSTLERTNVKSSKYGDLPPTNKRRKPTIQVSINNHLV